jgi:hypothetical protein
LRTFYKNELSFDGAERVSLDGLLADYIVHISWRTTLLSRKLLKIITYRNHRLAFTQLPIYQRQGAAAYKIGWIKIGLLSLI